MDFANLKSLTIPEGEVKEISCNGDVLWSAITFTNQVPISTDTDGSVFNGVGYIENRRLSSSGSLSSSAQNGSVTTGFIPITPISDEKPNVDVIRMKGVEWKDATTNYGGHYYINYYDNNKKFLDYLSAVEAPQYAHIVTVTRDTNGVETVVWNDAYGTNNAKLQRIRSASYIRITAYGKGADMIVTINEEIE